METPKEISEFLCANKVATVCYVHNGLPSCFNCLYAAIPGVNGIIFKSSKSSLHSWEIHGSAPVAGTIYQASKNGYDNTGVQFNGTIATNAKTFEVAEKAYYKRFPIALLMPGQLFVVIFDSLKFSQTTNGIRRKADWQKAVQE
ncbi:hypothetical protein CAP35_06940 [Chitinophagaceae bacterium IBVUCB1]|nr:hypothetical protein CAP35_06940 [Chitinophagaceae bacterium IBVUCB1]